MDVLNASYLSFLTSKSKLVSQDIKLRSFNRNEIKKFCNELDLELVNLYASDSLDNSILKFIVNRFPPIYKIKNFIYFNTKLKYILYSLSLILPEQIHSKYIVIAKSKKK